jgi:MFS transporter, ACS family, glucarate transporter
MSTTATRARLVLVVWLCGLAGVLYLDRICMAQAARPIGDALGLSNTHLSYVHMAFTLAYGLFEVPSGRLGDRFGSRAVLTRIVVWWSVFTALTGAAWGLGALLVIRFLFGAGEAGAYPNAARVMSRWFPAAERGRVQGLMLTTALAAGAAAPTAAAYLIEHAGWRWAFGAFGAVGFLWAVGFWWWFRDDPAEHPSVNAAEVELIRAGVGPPRHAGPIPWAAVVRNPGIGLLGLAIVCSSFNSYLYYSWFSTYLQDGRKLPNIEAGWLSSLVLGGSAVGVLAGGVIADLLLRSGSVVWGRRLLGGSAYLVAAGCLFFAARTESPTTLAALAALSSLCVQLSLPTWWSAAIEQSGRHVGALFGLLNMMGTIGALASQGFVGAFADWRKGLGYAGREQWDPMFDIYVIVLLIGAATWLAYRKRPLE